MGQIKNIKLHIDTDIKPTVKSGHNNMDQDNMEEVEEIDTTNKTAELLRNNPELVAAVQAKLNGLVGMPSGFIDTLPQCVKNRLNALKNVQVQCAYLEGQFYEEAHQLEMKYAELFKPLYDKRMEIVNALYEPKEEEAKWVEPGEEEGAEDKAEKEEKSLEKVEKSEDEKMADSVL